MNASRVRAGLAVLPHFVGAQFPEMTLVLPATVRLTHSWWLVVHESQRDIARVRIVVDYISGLFHTHRDHLNA